MDNLTENERATAETAEAEKGENAAAVLGKFKDVQTLMKAYSDLEAEFTRRSQRLKELEKENKAEPEPDGVKAEPSQNSEDELLCAALKSERVKEAVIGDYLKTVSERKGVPLTAGGLGVAAPRVAPKSVKEAGRLAQEFLK
ncbi:MAG: hypothetical protein K2K60_02150 [Clostridia bacterium]|nr:hypothetical protein [Clostridia bacterium]